MSQRLCPRHSVDEGRGSLSGMSPRPCWHPDTRRAGTLLTLIAAVTSPACVRPPPDCATTPPTEPGKHTCAMPGYDDRDFDLYLPATARDGPAPLVLNLHGGGGNKNQADRNGCPDGDDTSEGCLSRVIGQDGAIMVAPNGTAGDIANVRTWSAGGGVDEYRCVGEAACDPSIDDVVYFGALLDSLADIVDYDPARVYATGISNGAAMSYRLACDLAGRITAIAPIAGANAAEVHPGCSPAEPVSVLHFHGTEDPCWRYEGGAPECPTGQPELIHVSVQGSLVGDDVQEGFVAKNGCATEPTVTPLPDTEDDDTTSEQLVWSGCQGGAEVQHIKITGGGHTWPQGWPYLDESTVGRVAQDFSANEMLWAFFQRFGGE